MNYSMNNKNTIFHECHNILSNIFIIFAGGILLFEDTVHFNKETLFKRTIPQMHKFRILY
jgi:hypothetical protein